MNRDVCDRCGKVTRPDDIHTCTPKPCPTCQALARAVMMDQTGYDMPPLRRLTDEVIADLWHKNGTYHHHFARAIERYLRGEQ
jgi:hypothetical protein